MKTTHTSGEWKTPSLKMITNSPLSKTDWYSYIQTKHFAMDLMVAKGVNKKEFEANIKLIAAAPELLEAAKWAVLCLDNLAIEMGQIGDSGDQALQALELAIKKATS
jgi:hypothetical protein